MSSSVSDINFIPLRNSEYDSITHLCAVDISGLVVIKGIRGKGINAVREEIVLKLPLLQIKELYRNNRIYSDKEIDKEGEKNKNSGLYDYCFNFNNNINYANDKYIQLLISSLKQEKKNRENGNLSSWVISMYYPFPSSLRFFHECGFINTDIYVSSHVL